MRNLWILALTIALAAPCIEAATTRTLADEVPAAGLDRMTLEAGVGDVEIVAMDGDAVVLEVVLKPRRGGIFSSMARAEREVQEARLAVDTRDGNLMIKVESDSTERRFEERWSVHLPARLAVDLDLGVGDVIIRGVNGGVNLDSGVGDVLVDVAGGDVSLDLGVGDMTVKAPAEGYGRVECSGGVGEARVTVNGRTVEGDGFVGHTATWQGEGPAKLTVDVGVGDARVTLD
jgi:hypothetical protein